MAGLVKKKNTSSPIWDHFRLKASIEGVVNEFEKNKPVCNHCNKGVAAKGGNTTNLFTHLRDNHPSVYAIVASALPTKSSTKEKQRQPTIAESITMSNKYSAASSQAINLDNAVAYCIAKDMLPLQIVDKPGFRHMLSKLNPRYNLPSRRHFSDISIPRLYSQIRDSVVRPKLEQSVYFSATTDLWTSANNIPYLTFTVHFIDCHWSLCSFCLETLPVFKDHTGENIADAICDVLSNWNLDPKNLIATTTDNGSNFLSAFRTLDWCRISCFAHNLDLAISKSLQKNQIQRVIKRCHALVSLFHRSWKKNRDLLAKQTLLNLPEHKLLSDVVTRWGSTFNMMDRIIEQQQAINAVLIDDRKNWHHMLSDSDFSVLENVCSVLKPLAVLTDGLSGEKEVTISALLPVMKHINTNLLCVSPSDNILVKEIKTVIKCDLQARYQSPKVALLLEPASYLDPRFRDRYLQNREDTLSIIKEECLSLMDESTEPSPPPEPEPPKPKKKCIGLGAILTTIAQAESSSGTAVLTPEMTVQSEMTAYLEFPQTEPNANPLTWWAAEEGRFPLLAKLARKYLSICGTSVSSERVFSRSGFIVNDFRCSLLPQNVNTLVFLASNMP